MAFRVICVTEKRKKMRQQTEEKADKGIQWKQKNHLYTRYVFV